MNIHDFTNVEVGELLNVTKLKNGYWDGMYPAKFRGVTKNGRVKIYNMVTKKNTAVDPVNINHVAKKHVTDKGRILYVPKYS